MALAWAGSFAQRQGESTRAETLPSEALTTVQATGSDGALARVLLHMVRAQRSDLARTYAATNNELAELVLAMYQRSGGRWGIGESLTQVATFRYRNGDRSAARVFAEQALAAGRDAGNRLGVAFALETLGLISMTQEPTVARSYLVESLTWYRELGNLAGIASVETYLGRVACLGRDFATALAHYRSSLGLIRDWAWGVRIVQALDGLAIVASAVGEPQRALRLAGASARSRQGSPISVEPREEAEVATAVSSARSALGNVAADRAWAEGQAMTLEQAVAYALEDKAS